MFLLTALLGCSVPYGLFVAFNYKEYGLFFIKDDHYLSILGSVGSVGNGLFRMFWGMMMDIFPFRTNIVVMIGVFMASCASIVWSVRSQFAYPITILLTYGCYGGLYSVFPTQTIRMLGRQLGPKLYYLTFLGFSIGGIIQYIFHKYLVETYKEDGYIYCFIIFGVFLFVALAIVLRVDYPQHQEEADLRRLGQGIAAEGGPGGTANPKESTLDPDD